MTLFIIDMIRKRNKKAVLSQGNRTYDAAVNFDT